eukprot:scaffold12984_cov125-Isochrysis_galbana.AAC.1
MLATTGGSTDYSRSADQPGERRLQGRGTMRLAIQHLDDYNTARWGGGEAGNMDTAAAHPEYSGGGEGE